MGSRDKLLEDVDGAPLLRQRAQACLKSGVTGVRVVLPPNRPERIGALDGLDVEIIFNDGSDLGMSHSLQRGVENIDADALLIVLADLPDLTAEHMQQVVNAAKAHPDATIFRGASTDGKAGHPVLLRKDLFSQLNTLTGDIGAQPLLQRHKLDTVLVPIGASVVRDLDTPEDWAAWRAEQSKDPNSSAQ